MFRPAPDFGTAIKLDPVRVAVVPQLGNGALAELPDVGLDLVANLKPKLFCFDVLKRCFNLVVIQVFADEDKYRNPLLVSLEKAMTSSGERPSA